MKRGYMFGAVVAGVTGGAAQLVKAGVSTATGAAGADDGCSSDISGRLFYAGNMFVQIGRAHV